MLRLVPDRCPRCQRVFAPDFVTRDASDHGAAGCPCGDVTKVFFDDPSEAPLAPSEAPPGWSEHARVGGWIATLKPEPPPRTTAGGWVIRVLSLVLMFAVVSLRLALASAGLGPIGFFTMVTVALAVPLLFWLAARPLLKAPWTLALEGGMLRIRRRGLRHDIPIAEIERIAVAERTHHGHRGISPKQWMITHDHELRIVLRDRLPIVLALPNAPFVAERIREMIGNEGRTENGYRGATRIAIDEPDLDEAEQDEGILAPVRRTFEA